MWILLSPSITRRERSIALQAFQTPIGTWDALVVSHLVYARSDKSDVHICWLKDRANSVTLIILRLLPVPVSNSTTKEREQSAKE